MLKRLVFPLLLTFALLPISLGLILLTLFIPTKVQAVETYIDGPVLFSDDFSSGSLTNWITDGHFYVDQSDDYKLAGSMNGLNQYGSINTDGDWNNFRIELDVNNYNGVDEGIGFRKKDNSNRYEVNIRHGQGEYQTPEVNLVKFQNGDKTILASTHSIPLIHNRSYHLKIDVVEDHIQMWVDDTLAFEFTDTGTKVKTGQFFISYWTGDYGAVSVRYDNVKVTSLTKVHYPVIFIPGIGGSEFKTNQDIYWNQDDGHGGTYSHAYPEEEKVWVNQDEAVKLGDDDYFDILRLNSDGQTSSADISLTGELTPLGYPDIDTFFSNLGYTKGTNYFVFAYDWRKDVITSQADLDKLIDLAKQKSGQPKVNIVAHSLGGLVARNYISENKNSAKVNKLIELGVPHLGTVESLKGLMYGAQVGPSYLFGLIALSKDEAKDIFQNLTSLFEILPSKKYYDFYDNTAQDNPYPFFDDRDIDTNQKIGALDYTHLKQLLANKSFNMAIFNLGEKFHDFIDPILNQASIIKIYQIVGTNQPTLGQIKETWWVTWPFKLFPKTDELFVNGDGVIPVYSASLKKDSLDLSGRATTYYVDQSHAELFDNSGTAMQTVKAILAEADLPVNVKSEKIKLKGKQVSVDNANLDLFDDKGNHAGINDKGQTENNIPGVVYDSTANTAFVKDETLTKVTTKVTPKNPISNPNSTPGPKSIDIKLRQYSDDTITKTTFFKDIPATSTTPPIHLNLNLTETITPTIKVDDKDVPPTIIVQGNQSQDLIPPTIDIQLTGNKDGFGNYTGQVFATIASTDTGSGVLKTEYSIDEGDTVQIYSSPFIISKLGVTTIQVISTDKTGNGSSKTLSINIINPQVSASPTPTSTPSPSPTYSPTPTSTPSPTSSATTQQTNTPSPSPTDSPTYSPNSTPLPTIIPTPIPSIYIPIFSPLPLSTFDLISPLYESPNPIGTNLQTNEALLRPEVLGDKAVAKPINFNFPEKKPLFNLNYIWLLIPILESIFFVWLIVRTLKKSPNEMNYPEPN